MNIEKEILGTLIAVPENAHKVFDILKAEHFEDEAHRLIFQSIYSFHSTGKSYDIILITNDLKSKGVLERCGGAYYISKLTDKVIYSSNIEKHCYIVLESFLRDFLYKNGLSISNDAKNPLNDPIELIEQMSIKLRVLTDGLGGDNTKRIDEIGQDVIGEIQNVLENGVSSGIKSGINRLNIQTNGWQKSDLIILAGRPGMGKTSAALDFALTPALEGKPVLFCSLEMSKEQLTSRALSVISGIDVQRIVNKTINKDELSSLNAEIFNIEGVPLFIEDKPNMSIREIRSIAMKLKNSIGLELIIVDYLQLMKGDTKGNREQEISEISRGLKILAKEFKVPVIALSQLSRKCEERADKKPMLSDLRESGAIEQDADMVLFCFRPEYYEISSYLLGGNELSTDGLFIFIISKFRNGQTGEIKARWIGNNTKVTNYEDPF